MNNTGQKIMRSREDKIIAGVCGAIGHHFALDPLLIRLIFVILLFGGGIGILLYPLLWLIIPLEPEGNPTRQNAPIPASITEQLTRQRNTKFGTILVVLGTGLMINQFVPWIYPFLIPALLIGSGIVLFYRTR